MVKVLILEGRSAVHLLKVVKRKKSPLYKLKDYYYYNSTKRTEKRQILLWKDEIDKLFKFMIHEEG